jgi:Concanavalin A-like lectin/glucanases superfamily
MLVRRQRCGLPASWRLGRRRLLFTFCGPLAGPLLILMALTTFFQSTLRRARRAAQGVASPAWDYQPGSISADTLVWENAGTRPGSGLELRGAAVVEPTGGPNGAPCVALANHSCYEGGADLGLVGAAARTHLVIFQSDGTNNIELMGWGYADFNHLYDTMIYGGYLIQHFYGYEKYSATPVAAGQWNAWLVRGTPAPTATDLTLGMWLNGAHSEEVTTPDTGAGPLRIGTGHYENDPVERKIARVLIWDRALTDAEIADVQAWVLATYNITA